MYLYFRAYLVTHWHPAVRVSESVMVTLQLEGCGTALPAARARAGPHCTRVLNEAQADTSFQWSCEIQLSHSGWQSERLSGFAPLELARPKRWRPVKLTDRGS